MLGLKRGELRNLFAREFPFQARKGCAQIVGVSGYFIICQKPSRLASTLTMKGEGVGAKLESRPSSFAFERISSPDRASCGRISHVGAPLLSAVVHQWAGYFGSRVIVGNPPSDRCEGEKQEAVIPRMAIRIGIS